VGIPVAEDIGNSHCQSIE